MATNDLNLESDSELSDAASNVFWTDEPVDVEFEKENRAFHVGFKNTTQHYQTPLTLWQRLWNFWVV